MQEKGFYQARQEGVPLPPWRIEDQPLKPSLKILGASCGYHIKCSDPKDRKFSPTPHSSKQFFSTLHSFLNTRLAINTAFALEISKAEACAVAQNVINNIKNVFLYRMDDMNDNPPHLKVHTVFDLNRRIFWVF